MDISIFNQSFTTNSEEETQSLAERLAGALRGGEVLALRGGLGAGKTAFVRGLARGLGIPERVTSPTFALVHEYAGGRLPLYHFDMYRVQGYDSLCSTGFYDYLEMGGVIAVEWSENIATYLPEDAVTVTMETAGDNVRRITMEGTAV